MTQQLDPKQVRGLREELDTLDSLAKIKTIGANLSLSEDGELSATGGGGGGGEVNLYSTLGQNIDGALTQKASTDLLAHKDDFDTLESTVGSLSTTVSGKEPAITAGTTSQYWRGDKTWQTLDKSAVGLGNVDNTSDATKKSNYTGTIASGDTGFVTGGDVYTAVNGTIQAEQTVSTDPVTATVTTNDITTSAVTTAKIDDGAVTTPKIADGAVTTAKIASGAVTASNIDFTTLKKFQTICVATLYHTFTAEVAGTLMLLGVGSSTWGYDGGSMRLGFTKDSGDATVQAAPTILVEGGNTIGRTVVVSAKVKFQAGQTAQLTVSRTDGVAPQNFTTGFCFGIFIPDEYA